ncbi:MAG: ABC transporter ATP-binding protein [Spirochaetales bacterium]|uniref:ABC transporter ATP-binding protein n=1 Tax=Candidatus Thalassospirochaeta sargassi TaxID=3119039 RepID=A0AAJ1MKY2_9SPIO|nr:ABC transporter ATP-binding protein [Spirochaetales bacterium]
MLEVKNLSFNYSKKNLFDDLSLEVQPGLYGLLGKNGAGKSTLLKLMSGELFPQSGSCLTMGVEALKRTPEMLSEIYYLPEEFELPSMTGNRYVESYSPFYPKFSMDFFRNCAEEFEIYPGDKLNSMSYGQRKKFMISFGLATWSSILLLDEPTNGLDIPSKSQFRRLAAAGASDERIILVSTHQVRDMENLIDPIIIVEEGKIIFNRSMEEISECISFQVSDIEPVGDDVVYYEKILGGFLTAYGKKDMNSRAVDLEFLFNMVVAKGKSVNGLFNGGVK